MIKELDGKEKADIVPKWLLSAVANHGKQSGIAYFLEHGGCAGRYLSFQIDDDAKYTGKVALCDKPKEVRQFAYPPLILDWRNKTMLESLRPCVEDHIKTCYVPR